MTMETGFFILAILGACGSLWAYLEGRIKAEVRLSQGDRSRLFERDEALRAEINVLRTEIMTKYVDRDHLIRVEDRLYVSIAELTKELKDIRSSLDGYFKRRKSPGE